MTGFCDVLCSSSIVFWSYLKSFLQPTRMMGRPEQKCRTSEIHCSKTDQSAFIRQVGVLHATPWARERVIYLLLDVVQRIRRVDGEADEDDM